MNTRTQEYKKRYQIIRLNITKEVSHGICVSNLAYRIGKEVGLSGEECRDLVLAGFLHDIGKLELSRYICGREEQTLTIEEMRYVRWHPQLGAEILEERGFSPQIVEMVRHHHENCDGSGFPANLTRAAIAPGAKILRISDVFAALTSDRPYRKAFDTQTAIRMMIEEAKNYDIQYFLAFMRIANSEQLLQLLNGKDVKEILKCYEMEHENFHVLKQDMIKAGYQKQSLLQECTEIKKAGGFAL